MNSTNGPEPKHQSGRFEPNPHQVLGELHESGFAGQWVPQDTAVLIVHGIGNKHPFDTLDQFARTLVETCRASGRNAITMTHFTAAKPSRGTGGFWYDNFIRLTFGPQQPRVDIYEYYWAYQTGDKASLSDIQNWVTNVTGGARRFYRDNAEFGRQYGDSSPFFAKKPGGNTPSPHTNFRSFRYWFFITTVAHVIPATLGAVTGTLRFLSRIPIVGWGFDWLLHQVEEREVTAIANVIGDIAIYNTTDAKSKFYAVRKAILDGAVNVLRYLLEPVKATGPYLPEDWPYGRVILADHSLGSQISFDAINRLNHLVHQGELRGCDNEGYFTDGTARLKLQNMKHISDTLCGLVTFGSPLDKMAFFFREQTEKDEYLRRQLIEHFHGFKQRPWSERETDPSKRLVAPPQLFSRLFDDIRWRNYYDRGDLVSGALDYYQKVVNVDCRFRPSMSLGEFYVVLALCLAVAALVFAWMALIWNARQWLLLFLKGTGAEWMTKLRELSVADAWLLGFCVLLLVVAAAVPLAAFAARFTHSNYWGCRRMFADIVDEFLLPSQPPRHTTQSTVAPAGQPTEARAASATTECPHSHRAAG
ncbi:MAG: hypothetical protein DME23_18650 [Verrucomicrobia bacterium]|nr:MAG: hypothetical protein DME23_18650 [Verrucomicrobiota bacterium]